MESLQDKTARALAEGWLKKQEAFLQTIAPSLRDNVRLRLGCVDNADRLSRALLKDNKDDTERMINSIIDSYSDLEYDGDFATMGDVTLRPQIAERLNLPEAFMGALISFKDSTLTLTQLVTAGNIGEMQHELTEAGMTQEEFESEVLTAEETPDKETEMFKVTYVIPLMLVVGTRIKKSFDADV
jgi:hypothetical protein